PALLRDAYRRRVARVDHADRAQTAAARFEPSERGADRLGRVSFALRRRYEHPARLRSARERRSGVAPEVGEADFAHEAACRLRADDPIAKTEERPEPRVAEEPRPCLLFRGRTAADEARDVAIGPHRGAVAVVVARVNAEREAIRVDGGGG